MKEKKLIYILNHYSDNSAQHFFHVVNLLEKMAEKGVQIILLIEKCESTPNILSSNIKVVTQKETNKVKRLRELKKILRTYMKQGYKRVFVRISLLATVVAIHVANKYGAEVFYWQSGDNLTYDRKKKGLDKIKYLLTNHLFLLYIKNNVHHFVTGPETMVKYYQKELNIDSKRMTLLYNDIDISRFSVSTEEEKISLRKQYGIGQEKKVILFVHRLTPVKRFYLQLPYVIEKKEFRDANAMLVIAGTGPDYNQVMEQVKKSPYKDLVKMVGAVPNKEVMNYYKMADVFINPSYSEGFPRVVIEAMACGLPVVATDVGGTCDIVGEQQRKYIIDKDDRNKFRDCVLEFLTNEDICNQVREENLKIVKKYSTETVAQMYIDTIFK